MKKYIYSVGLGILLLITLFILPVWNIQKVEIEGNHYYTKEELLKAISFKEGMHSLGLRKDQMRNELLVLPYIRDASIEYTFPNHLLVKIVERQPLGYVKFLDSYICIDEEGYVVEESSKKRLDLPEIEGLKFKQFTVGEKLILENSEQLGVIREMLMVLKKYNFVEEVDVIQVSNIQEIHLYVDKLNVIIGNIRDFDKKVRYLIEVHKQYAMGILDLSFVEYKQAILKPMG